MTRFRGNSVQLSNHRVATTHMLSSDVDLKELSDEILLP